MPNCTKKSLKRLQKYGDLTVFKMAAVRHFEFSKFKFFTRTVKHFAFILPNFAKVRQSLAVISRFFCDFQGRCHLGFSKIRNLNDLSPVGVQSASSCQILSKSVKRLRRYGDLTFFQNNGRSPF